MLVFIHINKSGGNTVSHILRSSYGPRHCQVEAWSSPRAFVPFSSQDLQRLRKLYPNLKSIAGHRLYGYVSLHENGTEFEYFTLMRDPVKRCASRFQFNIQMQGKKNQVFEEWIQQDYPRNLSTKWIAGEENVDKAIWMIQEKNIFVGLTERFDESMVMLKALVAKDLSISYKRVNVARDNTIAEGLLTNENTRQMLIESQKTDLELYNYVKQELYPTYQREYGPTLEADVTRFRQTQSNNFNMVNLTLCRLKHFTLYKPLLDLSRKGMQIV